MSCLNPNCQQQNISGTRVCTRCGTKLVLRSRYRVEKFIGEGGFGRTFKAVDEDKLNKPCVIKQFLPQQMGSSALAKATILFEQEAERLDQLGSHPQIPDLLAFFEDEGRLYLIQQFIDGQDLLKKLSQNGKFTESQVRQVLIDLLPVLDFIHSHNIIHRDIKPDNIIRNSNGTLSLIDFGVSKQLSGSILTKMGTITGTPGYAPPEQFRGMVYPASDLYSLGVTCIRLLTNCLPQEDGTDELFDSMKMKWIWRSQVRVSDENLGNVLDKMLQDLVGDRYQSATEVLQALQPSSVPSPPSGPTHKSVSIPLKSERGVDYTKLQNFLSRGQWKEADEETNNVMLQAAGRTQQGYLDLAACRNFPSLDLRTIDQLWLKYSDNKFGFTVQKEIWLAKGGKLDGSYDWDTYFKLAEVVGWRRGDNWLNYSQLTFDKTKAQIGHLPACCGVGWGGVVGGVGLGGILGVYSSLFSRLAQ